MRWDDSIRDKGMHPSCVESRHVLGQDIDELDRKLDNLEIAALHSQFFNGSILMLMLLVITFYVIFSGIK